MRILVVVHGFPPHARGGAEIYAEQHTRALARLFGDDIHVLTREARADRPEYAVRTERRDGVTITWVNNTFGAVRTYEESYRGAPIARIAATVIDEFRPDGAHIHHLTCLSTEIPALLASRGVPVICTLHDYWLLCHRGQLLDTSYRLCQGPEPTGCLHCLGSAAPPAPPAFVPALRAIERRLPIAAAAMARSAAARMRGVASDSSVRLARQRVADMRDVCRSVTRFLAPSASIRDRFIAFGITPERIELWPYGFDRTWAVTERPARVDGPLRIGFLGTLMASKAPHILLEAFAGLPRGVATIDLAGAESDYHGDTSYRRVLEPLVRLPGVRVTGPQPRERVPELLRSLDVLVVPSIWPETSPLVIQEAFLCGVPVVASRIGGIPELVDDGRNGLLFEPGDVEALGLALRRLVREPGLLDRLRAGAAATTIRSIEDDAAATRRLHEAAGARRSPARTGRRRVAAVVLNFGAPADTAIAVASLLASDRPPDETIVVDNDAEPGCRHAVARWRSAITYLPLGANLGFSAGTNAGIRHALDRGADAILLVNSDVVVPPDCLGRLEAAFEGEPTVGIAGPALLSRSSPELVGSYGIDYSLRTGRMRHRATGTTAAAEVSDADVDAVSGCLMLVAREVFERVGLLDERYFFGFEDVDFCLRAKAFGIRTRLVGRAFVYHQGGQSIGRRSPQRLYFAARNHLMLAATHPAGGSLAGRTARALVVVALNLAHAAKAPGGSMPVRLGATLHGVGDYLRGRMGAGPLGQT